MYSYSPIKTIRVKNFRNIGDVELSFEDSPIITLVGSNEAGKTSIIKAFAACALHANPREQKDWIRDTTKMFGVEINLEDGTQLVRVKEDGGINLYRIIYPDKQVWDVTKITDGLPVPVQKIMGLIEEPETGEFLHIRTYEDRLLFVVTPDSTNYKVMYSALKVEQLTKAIKLGSNQVNTLKQEVNRNENSLDTLRNQLRSIKVIDVESLLSIRERLKYQLSLLDKLEKAVGYKRSIEEQEAQLGAIALVNRFNLQPIDELLVSNINRVNNILNNKVSLKISASVLNTSNSIEIIDTNLLDKLSNLISKKNELRIKVEEAGAYIHINKIPEINEALVIQLYKTVQLLNKRNSLQNQVSTISLQDATEVTDKSLDILNKLSRMKEMYQAIKVNTDNLIKINDYLEQVQEYLKQCGVAVESCPKCGEAVVFDIDKLGDTA